MGPVKFKQLCSSLGVQCRLQGLHVIGPFCASQTVNKQEQATMETKLSAMMLPPGIEATQITVPILIHRLRVDPIPCSLDPVEPIGGVVTAPAFIGALRELLDVIDNEEGREKLDLWLAGKPDPIVHATALESARDEGRAIERAAIAAFFRTLQSEHPDIAKRAAADVLTLQLAKIVERGDYLKAGG